MAELKEPKWRKSSRSGSNGGACVELASYGAGRVAARDSKNPGGGILVFGRSLMAAFLAQARDGRYDLR